MTSPADRSATVSTLGAPFPIFIAQPTHPPLHRPSSLLLPLPILKIPCAWTWQAESFPGDNPTAASNSTRDMCCLVPHPVRCPSLKLFAIRKDGQAPSRALKLKELPLSTTCELSEEYHLPAGARQRVGVQFCYWTWRRISTRPGACRNLNNNEHTSHFILQQPNKRLIKTLQTKTQRSTFKWYSGGPATQWGYQRRCSGPTLYDDLPIKHEVMILVQSPVMLLSEERSMHNNVSTEAPLQNEDKTCHNRRTHCKTKRCTPCHQPLELMTICHLRPWYLPNYKPGTLSIPKSLRHEAAKTHMNPFARIPVSPFLGNMCKSPSDHERAQNPHKPLSLDYNRSSTMKLQNGSSMMDPTTTLPILPTWNLHTKLQNPQHNFHTTDNNTTITYISQIPQAGYFLRLVNALVRACSLT